MKKLANIIEKSSNEIVSELYTNGNGSGLFEYSNCNYNQLSGTCQIHFTGSKANAKRLLIQKLGYFIGVDDSDSPIYMPYKDSEYKISFRDCDFF